MAVLVKRKRKETSFVKVVQSRIIMETVGNNELKLSSFIFSSLGINQIIFLFIYYVLQKIGSQSIMVSFSFLFFFSQKIKKDLLSVLQLITCQCCLINTRNVPPPSYWPTNGERTKVIKQGMYSRLDVLKQPWVYMLYGFTQFFNYFFSMVLIFFQKT